MDLDTNVKKFRYSPVFKLICVVLSLVCFSASAYLALSCVTAIDIRNNCAVKDKDTPESWVETGAFNQVLVSHTQDIIQNTTHDQRVADYKKELASSKESVVAQAVEKNLDYIAGIEKFEQYKELYDYGDYSDENLYEMYKEEYFDYKEQSVNFSNKNDYYYSFSFNPINTTDKVKLTEYLNNQYDSFAENRIAEYEDQNFFPANYISKLDANFYAEFNDVKLFSKGKNLEFSESAAIKSQYYFIFQNGKLKAIEGIPEDIAKAIYDAVKHEAYFDKMYVCVYFNDVDIVAPDLIHFFDNNTKLALIKYTFVDTEDIYSNLSACIAAAVALLVISFVCAFMYFANTGRKSDDESAKLLFTDYVPVEIQAGIVGLAGFGLAVLATVITDGIYIYAFNLIYLFTILAVAILCWILLFCLCSSIGRYIHSDKKFYKHMLIYWVLFAVFKVLKKFFTAIWKFIKWIFSRIKKSAGKTRYAFGYKPTKFKRNVIAIACLYLAGNVILITLDVIFIATEAVILSVPLTPLIIAGNFIVIRKVAAYIKNLDIIIAASEKHEDTGLITELLDPSLQILNESMRYTNAELQQAISKAVKDERLRTELITNVSHDLKTPLTSIINYVDLLTKCGIEDERALEYLGVLTEKSGRLKRLIEDLIEASKLSSGNISVNLAPLNLSELCLQSTVDVQQDFEKAGLSLVVKQGEKPEIVIADGPKTYRVLENLFSNARKYSAKASRVYVSVFSDDTHGIIEIKNISAKPLDISADELTERFVRGDSSRNQEGNGLGLSIATELCKAMNGELEIIIDGDLFKARVKLPMK